MRRSGDESNGLVTIGTVRGDEWDGPVTSETPVSDLATSGSAVDIMVEV